MTAPIGSKANPSKYDAYPNLAEDEPYFVIRAHDLLSSRTGGAARLYRRGTGGRGAQQAGRDHGADIAEGAAAVGLAEVSRDVRDLGGDGEVAERPVGRASRRTDLAGLTRP